MLLQKRVEQLTGFLAGHLGFGEHQAAAESAARLALADVATATVTEMTALAGVMGRIYALRQGEKPEVAEAVFESVLPRYRRLLVMHTRMHVQMDRQTVFDLLKLLLGFSALQSLHKSSAFHILQTS